MRWTMYAVIATATAVTSSRPPANVFVLAGQSNMEGLARTETWDARASEHAFAHLRSSAGWRTFPNVFVKFNDRHGPLTVGWGTPQCPRRNGATLPGNGNCTGVEYEFGASLERGGATPAVLVKTAWGGHSLMHDFRPPSAPIDARYSEYVKLRPVAPERNRTVGASYRKMLNQVRATLRRGHDWFPELRGRDLRLSGLIWFQGWNDMYGGAEHEYARLLELLIADTRRDLEAPRLPVIVGVMGQNGSGEPSPHMRVIQEAQLRAARVVRNVRAVRTDVLVDAAAEALWPNRTQDPSQWARTGSDPAYHYYGSPLWHVRIGKAFADALLAATSWQGLTPRRGPVDASSLETPATPRARGSREALRGSREALLAGDAFRARPPP